MSSATSSRDLPPARVVVGVDFGTTYSGFAFAHISKPHEVNKYLEWADSRAAGAPPYCKTQTSLYYKYLEDGSYVLSAWGWPAQVAYREDAMAAARAARHGGQPMANRFLTKFKLHLAGQDNVSSSTHRLGDVPVEPLPYGLTAEQVVTDYIRELKNEIMRIIQTRYGTQLGIQEVQWCLTVPAIWSDDAKLRMTVCAERAGLVQGHHTPHAIVASPYPIKIVLEPEAAAMACWTEPGKHLEIDKGDHILVVDIGGGTVDIVVHEKLTHGSEEVSLREVAPSSGGLCGGTYVDQDYLNFLQARIPCFQEHMAQNGRALISILKQWHEFKATYDGEPRNRLDVELPPSLVAAWRRYDQHHGFPAKDDEEYEELRLTNADLREVFSSTVNEIMRLIQCSLTRRVKVLMAVGGFSASPYLMARLKTDLGKQVIIVNPNDPGGAICTGAVLMGVNPPKIVSRIARKGYGLATNVQFDPRLHPISKRWKDDANRYMCRDIYDVYVNLGDEVQVDSTKCFVYLPTAKKSGTITFRVFSSSTPVAPMFITDDGVSLVGSFEMDISDGLKLGRRREVEVMMHFGESTIQVQGRRLNFGDTTKIDAFKFAIEVA